MDAKDSFVFFLLLLLSLGLFGSLSLTYCLWSKQTEVASELQNDLRNKLQSELADMQTELRSKLQSELRNEMVNMFQASLNGKVHLGPSDPSQDKGQLKRNVRHAEDTETLANVQTEVNRIKSLLKPYMNCSTNRTQCTLKPGLRGEPGPEGQKGEPCQTGEPGSKGMKGNPGNKGEEGKEGLEGSQGPTGPTGPPGLPGPPGVQGKDGLKGEQGPVGPKGNTGPQGSQGPTGEKGQKGDTGERGPKGDMGPPGPQGETGERGGVGQKGEPGEKGIKGDQGYNGTKGEQGEAGLPAPTVAPTIAPTTPPPTTTPTTVPTTAPTTAPPPTTPECGGPEWRKVVFLDTTNTSHDCPTGLKLTTYSRRTCGRAYSGYYSCSSTTFNVDGFEYSRVCGRALAYRFGYNDAFRAYHHQRRDINDIYVDGLSLTHGASGSRQHIWTFASGLYTGSHKSNRARYRCPCDNGNTAPSPPFVGNDYFCESIQTESTWGGLRFFPNAPLWDGQVCEGGGTCCQFNNPPWFIKDLTNSTTDDIELRLCLLERGSNSDIALEQLELYVQ